MTGRGFRWLGGLGGLIVALALTWTPASAGSHDLYLAIDPLSAQIERGASVTLSAYLCRLGTRPGQGRGCRPAPARTTWDVQSGGNRVGLSRGRGNSIEVTGRRPGVATVAAHLQLNPRRLFNSSTQVRVVRPGQLEPEPTIPGEILVVLRTDLFEDEKGPEARALLAARSVPNAAGRDAFPILAGVDPSLFFQSQVGHVMTYAAFRCPTDEVGQPKKGPDGLPGTDDDDCVPEIVTFAAFDPRTSGSTTDLFSTSSTAALVHPQVATDTAVVGVSPGPLAIGARARDGLTWGTTVDVRDRPADSPIVIVDPPYAILGQDGTFDVHVCPPSAASQTVPEDLRIAHIMDLLAAIIPVDETTTTETLGCGPPDDASGVRWSLVGSSTVSLSSSTGPSTTVTGAGEDRAALVVRIDGVGSGLALLTAAVETTCPPVGLPGDYNGDGTVDAADYVVWRKDPAAHGGNEGYDTWRANFGASCP